MSANSFSIQFVGSGNAWSKPPVNYNTNAVVRANGHAWLIDCGLLCPLALKDFGISQSDIDGIFISHLHGDHVLGLEELLFVRYYACASRHNLWIPSDFLSENAINSGTHIWQNCLRAAMGSTPDNADSPLTLQDFADIHEIIPETPCNILGVECQIFKTIHAGNRPSFGITLNRRVAYTSDCTFSLSRIESLLNSGIETIFHETFFAPLFPGCIHTSFDELAELPRAMTKHIILMHYSDMTTQKDFERAESLGFRIAHPGEVFTFE